MSVVTYRDSIRLEFELINTRVVFNYQIVVPLKKKKETNQLFYASFQCFRIEAFQLATWINQEGRKRNFSLPNRLNLALAAFIYFILIQLLDEVSAILSIYHSLEK